MTVSVRGTPVHALHANTRSPVVTLPSGTVAGDLLLIIAAEIHGFTPSVPSGWTQVGSTLGLGGDASTIVIRKEASSGDVTAGNVTLTNIWPNTTDDGGTCCFGFYGHKSAAPINYVDQADNGLVTSVSGPACIPTVDNCLILHLTACDPLDTSYTGTKDSDPNTTTLINASLNDLYIFAQSFQQTTAASITIEATSLTSDTYYTYAIAIEPESTGNPAGRLLSGASSGDMSRIERACTLNGVLQ